MKFRGGRSTLSNGDMGDAHWRDNDLSWRHAYPSRLIKQSIPEKLYELNRRAVTGGLGGRDFPPPPPPVKLILYSVGQVVSSL